MLEIFKETRNMRQFMQAPKNLASVSASYRGDEVNSKHSIEKLLNLTE